LLIFKREETKLIHQDFEMLLTLAMFHYLIYTVVGLCNRICRNHLLNFLIIPKEIQAVKSVLCLVVSLVQLVTQWSEINCSSGSKHLSGRMFANSTERLPLLPNVCHCYRMSSQNVCLKPSDVLLNVHLRPTDIRYLLPLPPLYPLKKRWWRE
jgi:hypothetical protein